MANCSFCGRDEEVVEKLISGASAFICDRCIRLCMGIVEKKGPSAPMQLLKPKELHERLDEYIIGQNQAKRSVCVAVYNHYKRVRAQSSDHLRDNSVEYGKSNVMLMGPTGSGKTLIAKTLAKLLDVPFAIADATTLTEAGYVGEDVENILLRLLQAADFDVAKAERGVIYIDEIDKVRKTGSNVSITRDVSGEGVQQALLKIVEGTVANIPPKGGRKHPNQEYIKISTDNILFIAGGAFVHLDKMIAKRLGQMAIGFGTDAQKAEQLTDSSYLLSRVEPEDLVQFGMIPEFIGRFNTVVNCNELKAEDLVEILTKPKNALIKQYVQLFEEEKVKLTFTEGALKAIAEKAISIGTGARALRTILENVLRDAMFETPSDASIAEVVCEKRTIEKGTSPIIKKRSEVA